MSWLILVVFIDVAHVWSTLFRTYLNRENKVKFEKALWLVPLACYFIGVILYGLGALTFWRVLAYVAVFHFIRQQYGLYALYYGKEFSEANKTQVPLLHKVTIYSSAFIPIILWHLKGPQSFNWFISADFSYFNLSKSLTDGLIQSLEFFGPLILGYYCLRGFLESRLQFFSRPKFWIVISTYISWWTGIIWIANDWSFTFTNVLTHGLPYFTLIGLFHFSDHKKRQQLIWPKRYGLLTGVLFLMALGLTEEAFWDVFLWREQQPIFGNLYGIKSVKNLSIETLLVPLLALPQATHYALDGLIWRRERF
jgi:hypothetical protein